MSISFSKIVLLFSGKQALMSITWTLNDLLASYKELRQPLLVLRES